MERETESPTRFTAIVSSAISAAGANTAHGFRVRMSRFSLTISPQSDRGGCSPSPRKFTEATSRIENVKRRPGVGDQRREDVRAGSRAGSPSDARSPRATAAST